MIKNTFRSIKKFFFAHKSHAHGKIRYQIIQRAQAHVNIVFFLPAKNYPSGGMVVAHGYSDAINEQLVNNVQSFVMYPSNIGFSPNFFVHKSSFKRDFKIDKKKDFIILPEVMVLRYAPGLAEKGIKYGIHVQNGYLMDLELRSSFESFDKLHKAYQNAAIIIGNSIDTVKNIEYVFPDCKDKVIRSYFVIDKHKHKPISEKKNIITYMPRKLAKHSQHVLFFLNNKIPANWEIVPIDGVTEQEVYDIFTESKIFLSFSEFEGLAMPPAMAAMSGNKVIGYTGEANKEYFHLSCFKEVLCGDIKFFAKKVIETINDYDNGNITLDLNSIHYLEELFSRKNQDSFLRELTSKATGNLS